MNRRLLLGAGALLLALTALLLPTGWYDTIPHEPGIILPIPGTHLLRLSFLLEAVILAALAMTNTRFTALSSAYGEVIPGRTQFPADLSRGAATLILLGVVSLGLALRINGIGQDLWLDEITPLNDYMSLDPIQVIASYRRSNNHLLNTLLERISVGVFGEREWSVRLPAVIFGVLTIPALYWVSRLALSRIASLGASLVLAVSYHHVFFSQNARGYTAYILFAVLATGLFIKGLKRDRLGTWALYVLAVVLGSASLLLTGFVILSHVILCAVVAFLLRRKRIPVFPFARRMLSVYGIAGMLIVHLYSAALPEVYAVINSVYLEPGTGYPPFSAEFFREMQRGLTAGFGGAPALVAFLLLGAAGFLALVSFSWPLAFALVLPPTITAASLTVRGLTFSPRFFLLLLPLAVLAAMSAISWIVLNAHRLGRISPRFASGVVALGALAIALAGAKSLPYYYRTPKQSYRNALSLIERERPSSRIVVISNAAGGFQYYARRMKLDTTKFVYVRSPAVLDSLTAATDHAPPVALTTFSRALSLELPEIGATLSREWQVDTTFASTVGDGEIIVWSRKSDVFGREAAGATR